MFFIPSVSAVLLPDFGAHTQFSMHAHVRAHTHTGAYTYTDTK